MQMFLVRFTIKLSKEENKIRVYKKGRKREKRKKKTCNKV